MPNELHRHAPLALHTYIVVSTPYVPTTWSRYAVLPHDGVQTDQYVHTCVGLTFLVPSMCRCGRYNTATICLFMFRVFLYQWLSTRSSVESQSSNMKPLVSYLTSNLDLSTRRSLGAGADTHARNLYKYADDRVDRFNFE